METIGIHRVVSARPVSKLRKDQDKKGKNRQNKDNKNVSFNECFTKKVEDLKELEDYEESRSKRLLK
ncbi:MAG: hypothetical protein K2L98_00445 [Bacilli bacterium]|nr:hypothetical protein [Bacilli bacterium]